MAISIDDDAALRAKVEEALNVYDEPGDSVKPKDGIKEGASEEIKS
jgi:hypothetical protein